ncbi:MAG TPA: hypothetical protein VMU01_12625 [Rhizomicrobium sp.]|nr:hypothetical protein [Rhizomicrobium sp.]
MMRKILLAIGACAAFAVAAPAQDLPPLAEFLTLCYRDSTTCRAKLSDYIDAADTQKSICRPAGQSVREAVTAMLDWMRMSDQRPAGLERKPYDEAFWIASSTMWPCPTDPAAAAPTPAPNSQPAPAPGG